MSALSRRPVYLILLAALTAAAGNGISMVAFPRLVLQRTGSVVDASIVAGAASLSLLLSTLIAGAAVDYFGRQGISIISDAISGSSTAAVPLLAVGLGPQSVTVGVLAVLAALGAVFKPVAISARISMLPEAAAQAGWTLDRAYQASYHVAYIIGPGVGGMLIGTIGGVNTMWSPPARSACPSRRSACYGWRAPDRSASDRHRRGPGWSGGCGSCGTSPCCARWR